jgi:hypothetical protein
MNKVLVMVTIILSVSCKKNVESVILPSVATNPITYISDNSALTGGNITNDGGGAIINRGICFDVFPLPTIEKNKIESGSGSGSFTSIMNGLIVDKLYYVRAYATNSAGTSYGKELKYRRITTKPGAGVSFNGYNYKSVILGNGQEWITENLRTSTFSNGVPIKEVKREGASCILENILQRSTPFLIRNVENF